MRTRWLVWLVLCVAMAAPLRAADLASVVSEDALLYVEVSDPKGVWADFEQSGLRDMIRALPQGELQFRMVAGIVQQVALTQLGLRLGEFAETHAKRFAIVVAEPPGAGAPMPCLLFDVAKTKDAMRDLLRNTVERTLKANERNATVADDLHQDVAIRLVSAGGRNAAYVFLGDILVTGTREAVKRLIDARAQRPLSANKPFTKVRAKLAVPKGIVAYLNLRRILADNKAQLDANPDLARKLDDIGLTTLQWAAWSSAFDGRGIRDRLILYSGERRVGLLRLLGSLSQGASTGALVVPKECPIFASFAFKDGPELWQAILRYLEEGGNVEHLARLDEGRNTVFLHMGINFDEDFVGALGGEIFFAANPDAIATYAAKGKMPQRADLPYIIGLRVAKPDAMKTTIHRFIASQPMVGQGVERKVSTHRGTEISTISQPGRDLRPAYAFVGDYLLIARSSDVIRCCIDAKADNQGLGTTRRYKPFLSQMPARHNGLLYADVEGILLAALTQGKGLPTDRPPKPGEAIAAQLRGTYATLAAEEDGLVLETYTRPGLAGILGAVLGFSAWERVTTPTVVPGF